MNEHFDVIIIGTGAGGGALARHLAPSGKKILLLERGGWLPREPQNWSTADVFEDGRYISPDTWYDAKGKTFQPQVHYYVGGATKLYGAALIACARRISGPVSRRISPAGDRLLDMEPYTMAGELYQVRGARGGPDRPPSARPTLPGLPTSQGSTTVRRSRGRRPPPFHAPCSVLGTRTPQTSICVRCSSATTSRTRCTPRPTPR
jgi:hypothetical protein